MRFYRDKTPLQVRRTLMSIGGETPCSYAPGRRGLQPRLPVDYRRARAVTPIPTRGRFSCIAYLALAMSSV